MTHQDPDLPEDIEDPEHPTDMEAEVRCPYCGESVEISLDPGSGAIQDYVEDCQVCCQPIDMELRVDENGDFLELLVRRGDA